MAKNLTAAIRSCFKLELNFISENEEKDIIYEVMRKLKFMRWNENHFDGKIHNYREYLASDLFQFPALNKIMGRVNDQMMGKKILPVHILELRHDGQILPHIDNKSHSGSIIAGLSLQRDSILTLSDSAESESILLPRRSFYRQMYFKIFKFIYFNFFRDDLRFNYEHSITFKDPDDNLQSRISLMYRDAH